MGLAIFELDVSIDRLLGYKVMYSIYICAFLLTSIVFSFVLTYTYPLGEVHFSLVCSAFGLSVLRAEDSRCASLVGGWAFCLREDVDGHFFSLQVFQLYDAPADIVEHEVDVSCEMLCALVVAAGLAAELDHRLVVLV